MEEFNSHRMKWPDIILPEDAPQAKEAFKQALGTEAKSYVREYRIKTKTGEIRWIREKAI